MLWTHKAQPSESTTNFKWWRVSLPIRVQIMLNHIQIVLLIYHNIKDYERNLCQDLLTIEHRPTLERACAALSKWATCMCQTLLSKTFANSEKNTKQIFGKRVRNDTYSLLIRAHTTFRFVFYHKEENVIFQSTRWKRHRATHWHEQRGMDSYWQWQINQSDCEIYKQQLW